MGSLVTLLREVTVAKSLVSLSEFPGVGPGGLGPFPLGPLGDDVVVRCTAEEDMARQEYRLSSDLAYQVQRFGVGTHGGYGEQDFDLMDRTRAIELVQASQALWLELPRVVRDRYQSWANVEAAAASGELEQVLKAAGVDGGSLPAAAAAVVGAGGTSPEAP